MKKIALITAVCMFSFVANAAEYSVQDLGFLGLLSWPSATDMNNAGQITGFYNEFPQNRAFRWDPIQGMQSLYGGNNSYGRQINDAGQVVGQTHDGTLSQAFYNDPTTGTTVLADYGSLYGINNVGQVVGYYSDGIHNGACFGTQAGVSHIEVLGAVESRAYSINDNGLVAGYWNRLASFDRSVFVWNSNTNALQDLGSFKDVSPHWGHDSIPQPIRINSAGQILVYQYNNGVVDDNILWDPTLGAVELGALFPNTPGSRMFDLNDAGQVVGTSCTNLGGDIPISHAVVWDRTNGLRDLNSLIDIAGWEFTCARSINDHGQILAEGTYNGYYSVVVLTPVPEPAVWIMLITMAMMIFLVFFRPCAFMKSYFSLVRWREKK